MNQGFAQFGNVQVFVTNLPTLLLSQRRGKDFGHERLKNMVAVV